MLCEAEIDFGDTEDIDTGVVELGEARLNRDVAKR